MTPRGLIKRRNSDEAVNPGFAVQQAVSIFAGELNGGRLEARFFSRRLIEDLGGHALAFRPAQVHAEKNGCPILRFGSTSAGLGIHSRSEEHTSELQSQSNLVCRLLL